MRPLSVGILGCGAIFPAYVNNLRSAFAPWVTVTACADVVEESARKRAAEFNLPRACTPEEMFAAPDITLIVNLTPAPTHHASSLAILNAGKHLFSEKPLALNREHAAEINGLAQGKGLKVGGAADTFLGASLQFARQLIDEGAIGTPLAAQAIVALNMYHSERYHSVFGGALLDMGPYYLTALVALLGPVATVTGFADVRFPRKPLAASGPKSLKSFVVDIPTTVSAALSFNNGVVATVLSSCDVWSYFPRIEIHGTAGSLVLNDANHYGGPLQLSRPQGVETLQPKAGFIGSGRGLGLAEMAQALHAGLAPRANGELMYHVLDVLIGISDSSTARQHYRVPSKCERPAPFLWQGPSLGAI